MAAPIIASGVAAIFINNCWVQSPSRTGALALAIQIGGWIWYFAALQTALSGWVKLDWSL